MSTAFTRWKRKSEYVRALKFNGSSEHAEEICEALCNAGAQTFLFRREPGSDEYLIGGADSQGSEFLIGPWDWVLLSPDGAVTVCLDATFHRRYTAERPWPDFLPKTRVEVRQLYDEKDLLGMLVALEQALDYIDAMRQ
jgi:hypothetical protein